MRKIFLFLIFSCSFSVVSADFEALVYSNGFLYLKTSTGTDNGTAITSSQGRYPIVSPDGTKIVYSNASDGYKLYIKTSTGTDNGTAITSVTSYYPSFSPDGTKIAYANVNDGYKLYIKTSTGTDNGTAITSQAVQMSDFSPDGTKIVYVGGANNYLYRKTSAGTDNGTAITSVTSNYPDHSPDGTKIVYTSFVGSPYKLYLKTSAGTDNGTAITSVSSYNPRFSPDGTKIVYSNVGLNPSTLYLKTSAGTDNGTAITSVAASYPYYLYIYIPPETCSDGIQNQDEIRTDYGGICGGSSAFSYSGYLCDWKEVKTASNDFTTYYTVGDLSDYVFSTGSTQASFQWSDTTGKDYDYFEFNGIDYNEIYTGALVGVYSAPSLSLIKKDIDAEKQYGFNIKIETARNNQLRPINYIAVRGINGRGPGEAVFYEKDGTYIERQAFENTGSGIYVAQARNTIKKAYKVMIASLPINQGFPFWGIKFGSREQTRTFIPYCNADRWDCTVNDQGNICSTSSFDMPTSPACGFSTLSGALNEPGICIPILTEAEAYSGSTNIGKGYDINYEEEEIFSCNETGLSVLICPFIVFEKVWSKFTIVIKKLVNLIYGISSLGSPSGQGNIFSFLITTAYATTPQLDTPFDISGSGTSSETYTGADMLNLNKTILKASDNVYNMDSGGIKGIYALSMWFVILAGIVVIIVIFLIAFR